MRVYVVWNSVCTRRSWSLRRFTVKMRTSLVYTRWFGEQHVKTNSHCYWWTVVDVQVECCDTRDESVSTQSIFPEIFVPKLVHIIKFIKSNRLENYRNKTVYSAFFFERASHGVSYYTIKKRKDKKKIKISFQRNTAGTQVYYAIRSGPKKKKKYIYTITLGTRRSRLAAILKYLDNVVYYPRIIMYFVGPRTIMINEQTKPSSFNSAWWHSIRL